MNILSVNHLNVAVENRPLIHDLSFEINSKSLTCVTGENGVGKTTLMKTLLHGYRKNRAINFKIKRNQIQYVPQFRNVDDDYPLQIKSFIGIGLQKSWLPWLTKKEHQRINKIIDQTSLRSFANEPLGEASGGEQQRVFLAQALVSHPKLLILDETTASLDLHAKVELLKLVRKIIQNSQLAVMFITHDAALVNQFADYDLHIANHGGTMKKIGGKNDAKL